MIHPKVHSDVKGGASFKKSRRRGYPELSCLDTLPDGAPEVTFSLAVGSAKRRGPTTHCFRSSSLGRLPPNQAEWDLKSCLEGGAVTVRLYIEPCQEKVAPPEGAAGAGKGGDTAAAQCGAKGARRLGFRQGQGCNRSCPPALACPLAVCIV